MKRYKFRLQTVLDHRERAEDAAVQSYAQAKQAVENARITLKNMLALRVELMEGLASLRREASIDPQEQLHYQRYIQQVRDDITRQQGILTHLTQIGETVRLELVDASQDKKIVDKLKQNGKDAHEREALQVEQTEIDEIATLRHQHRIGQAA